MNGQRHDQGPADDVHADFLIDPAHLDRALRRVLAS